MLILTEASSVFTQKTSKTASQSYTKYKGERERGRETEKGNVNSETTTARSGEMGRAFS